MNLKRPLKLSARCCQTAWRKDFPCAIHQSVKLNSCRQKLSMQIFVCCSLFLIWNSHRRMHTLVLRWLFSRLEILFSLIIILSNWLSEHLAKKSHYDALYIHYTMSRLHVTAVYARAGVSWYFQPTPTPTPGFSTTPDFENHDTDTGNLYGFYKVVSRTLMHFSSQKCIRSKNAFLYDFE